MDLYVEMANLHVKVAKIQHEIIRPILLALMRRRKQLDVSCLDRLFSALLASQFARSFGIADLIENEVITEEEYESELRQKLRLSE